MLSSISFVFLLLTPVALVSSSGNYLIPISTSPLIQDCIKLIPPNDIFYAGDENFYSKVTLLDMSENSQTPLKDLILKKVNVIFMSAVSSLVGQTMDINDLKYTIPSKWAYNVPVDYMLAHAAVAEFNDTMLLYKIQEHAMSYLEDRYNFMREQVIDKLELELMEYLAPDQNQWVKMVGEITKSFIEKQSKKLNITSCYMAALVNRTLTDIQGYTLDEVDANLHDLENLKEKLPNFLNSILPRFYNAFSVTPETFPPYVGLNEQMMYYINNILNEFHLQVDDIASKYEKANEDILIPCENEWASIMVIIKEEAFEQHASNMSITNTTLAALLGIPYGNVKAISFEELKSLISDQINPIKQGKKLIEEKNLASLTAEQGELDADQNVFDLIASVTALAKNQLSLLYSFTNDDYQFAELFTINDMYDACSNNINFYDLVTLAGLNAGKAPIDDACQALPILKAIWNSNTVDEVEQSFGASISDEVLCSVDNKVTVDHVYRVLNLSENGKEVCSTVTLEYLTLVTSHPLGELKSMSFKQLVTLMEDLKGNGELYPAKTTTPPVLAPSPSSTISGNVQTVPSSTSTRETSEATPFVSGNNDSNPTSIATTPTRNTEEQGTHSSQGKNGDSSTVKAKKTEIKKSSPTDNVNSSTSSVIPQTPEPKKLSTGYRASSTNLYFLVAFLVVFFYR